MSTPANPNGYLLADTNALVYAYRAGREPLLDRYSKFAKKQGRELAITETIAKEIEDGPLKEELGRYIADRKIKVLLAPDTEQKLKAGQIPRKNSGELSMVEVAKREHTAGRSPGIWADDKFFRSPQNYRDAPGVQPVKTSELLDQMRSEQSITEPEYRHAQAGYQQTRPEFNPRSTEFSKRLGSFDGPEPRFIDHLVPPTPASPTPSAPTNCATNGACRNTASSAFPNHWSVIARCHAIPPTASGAASWQIRPRRPWARSNGVTGAGATLRASHIRR